MFTVYSNVTTIPVSPRSLIVASKEPCKPILATDEFATFKFSVTECGTKTYVSFVRCLSQLMKVTKANLSFFPPKNQNIGDTTIYMAEVRTAIRALNLKYGIITRDHPVRQVLVHLKTSFKKLTFNLVLMFLCHDI